MERLEEKSNLHNLGNFPVWETLHSVSKENAGPFASGWLQQALASSCSLPVSPHIGLEESCNTKKP